MSAAAVERERFIVAMQSEGMAPEIARRIMRNASTLRRLTVLQVNGDRRPYVECPGVAGERGTRCLCDLPDGQHERVAPVALEIERVERRIREWCGKASCTWTGDSGCAVHNTPHAPATFVPLFNGLPGGGCVKLKVPSGKTDDGAREGLCVPTRNY